MLCWRSLGLFQHQPPVHTIPVSALSFCAWHCLQDSCSGNASRPLRAAAASTTATALLLLSAANAAAMSEAAASDIATALAAAAAAEASGERLLWLPRPGFLY